MSVIKLLFNVSFTLLLFMYVGIYTNIPFSHISNKSVIKNEFVFMLLFSCDFLDF